MRKTRDVEWLMVRWIYTPLPLLLPFPLEVSVPVLTSASSLLSAFSDTELASGMPSDAIAVVILEPTFPLNKCYPGTQESSGKRCQTISRLPIVYQSSCYAQYSLSLVRVVENLVIQDGEK